MTGWQRILRLLASWWAAAWPLWVLLLVAGLAAVRYLPGGYPRAAVAVPILLVAPGSLLVGATCGKDRCPRGWTFTCFAMLLSMTCSVFVMLALYAVGRRITPENIYTGLLIASAVPALVAEARLLLAWPGPGRRAARQPGTYVLDSSDARPAARRAGYYSAVAVLAGAGLLTGGLYAYDRLPRPAPTGYTWLSWTNQPASGDIGVGATGSQLHFEIVHHQPAPATFRLNALWAGAPSHPLAGPLTVRIGPGKTFHGALFVPPLPDGCTYRLVLTLAATPPARAPATAPQSWSINANVHARDKPPAACRP
jgi:hypothetical protein